MFDIRSGHIYFQGQYFLYFYLFICSIFLVKLFALFVFVFSAVLVIISAAAPGSFSLKMDPWLRFFSDLIERL